MLLKRIDGVDHIFSLYIFNNFTITGSTSYNIDIRLENKLYSHVFISNSYPRIKKEQLVINYLLTAHFVLGITVIRILTS